jgi:serine/threonine protein kinase
MQQRCKVMHRDIKLENILVKKSGPKFEFKIGDLGQAKTHSGTNSVKQTTCGTPLYMAPEVYFGEPYNGKADVWSLGVMLFQLVTGIMPFYARTHQELREKLRTSEFTFPEDIVLSEECRAFVTQCLQKETENRPSLVQLTLHPFVLRRQSLV